MKRLIFIGLLAIVACAVTANLVLAQLPTTRTLAWDAPVADDTHGEATFYVVSINGTNTNVSAPITEFQFPITQTGPLNLSVSACNEWGCSSPSSLNLVVSVPGNSRNLRIR